MKKIPFILSLITLLLAGASCKKLDTTVGKTGLSDSYLESDAIDTFTLETSIYQEDSLVSDNLSINFLGSYNDAKTGLYEASFYTQFQLSGLLPDFGDVSSIVLDSFVLGLEYRGYYGNLDAQNVEVYELNEDIYLDSTYYSFSSKGTKATNLVETGKGLLTPDPINPTVIDGTEVDPQLRIHLDTNLAKTLINEATTNSTTFSSNENFLSYFKGLHIKVNNSGQTSGKGGILYFNINDPLSKLTIYYTQDGIKKTFDFLINSSCADFNQINITPSNQVQQVINNPSLGNETFFAQAFNYRGFVQMKGLSNIPKNAVIHYAQLELPVSYYSGDPAYPSSAISSSTKISSTDNNLYSLNQKANYSDFSKSYTLDLRDYVQDIVNGKIENLGIYLSPEKMLFSAERIVFNGPNSTNKKQPKLKIIYTTY